MENYGGFWRRVGAYIIDAILVGIVVYILSMVFGVEWQTTQSVGDAGFNYSSSTSDPMANVITIVVGVAYFAGMESSSMQATLGKKMLGMVVTDVNGNRISLLRAIGRYFAKYISAIILLIGFIMVAFTQRKQGLHDMIAGTLVHVGDPQGDRAEVFE